MRGNRRFVSQKLFTAGCIDSFLMTNSPPKIAYVWKRKAETDGAIGNVKNRISGSVAANQSRKRDPREKPSGGSV